MSKVLRLPKLFRARRPDPIAGGAVEIQALSNCWREIGGLHATAQLRVIEHLRQIVDERAMYEMREINEP